MRCWHNSSTYPSATTRKLGRFYRRFFGKKRCK